MYLRIESATDLRRYVRETYRDCTVEEQQQIYAAMRTSPDRPAYCPDIVDNYNGNEAGKGTPGQWRKFLRTFDATRVIG